MTIDLAKFCSFDRHRSHLSAPFTIGDYTYASNGHIGIRVPRRDDVPEGDPKTLSLAKTFADGDALEFRPLPDVPIAPPLDLPRCQTCRSSGKIVDCELCGGTGEHKCDCEHCDRGCDDCDGYGNAPAGFNAEPAEVRVCDDCDGFGRKHDERCVRLFGKTVLRLRYFNHAQDVDGPREVGIADSAESAVFFRMPECMIAIMPLRYISSRDTVDVEVGQPAETTA